MTRPGTIGWFALHEARLAWRDWLWLMTGGHRRRAAPWLWASWSSQLFMHGLAYLMLRITLFSPARPTPKSWWSSPVRC